MKKIRGEIIKRWGYFDTMEMLTDFLTYKPFLIVRRIPDGRLICYIQLYVHEGVPESFRCMGMFEATPGRLSFAETIVGEPAELGYRLVGEHKGGLVKSR
jgi:hypothetical protein